MTTEEHSGHSYVARLREMIEGLKANKNIRIQRIYLSEPAEHYELIDAQQQLPCPMPYGMQQMYTELGDFELAWSHKRIDLGWEEDDGEPITGSIRILPLQKLIKNWEDIIWFDFMEEDNVARTLIPFDLFTPEACAVLRPQGGQFEIDYHYCTEDLWPTGLSFDQWFDRLIMSRGMLYWLEACSWAGRDSYQSRHLRVAGPQLFEGFDATLFEPLTREGEIVF